MNAVAKLEIGTTQHTQPAQTVERLSGPHMLNQFGVHAAESGNYALAAQYFAPLVEKKYPPALYNFACMIWAGHYPEVTKEEATHYMLSAAKRGHTLAKAWIEKFFLENAVNIPATLAGYALCQRGVMAGSQVAGGVIMTMLRKAKIVPGVGGVFAQLPNNGGLIKISPGTKLTP